MSERLHCGIVLAIIIVAGERHYGLVKFPSQSMEGIVGFFFYRIMIVSD